MLCSYRHVMKRYHGLDSKSLGVEAVVGIGHLALIDTDSFALGFGICGLTASALWRIPLGAMTSVTLQPGGQIDVYWPGARERFFIVRAGYSPPFLLLLLPSRLPPLPIPSFRSRPLLLPFPTFQSLYFTCKITNVKNHNYHNPQLGVGNGCVQNKSSSKECTITKIGLCATSLLYSFALREFGFQFRSDFPYFRSSHLCVISG